MSLIWRGQWFIKVKHVKKCEKCYNKFYQKSVLKRFSKFTAKCASVSFLNKVSGWTYTLHRKLKFSITDFFSKCDQIWSFLQIWSHLLKKSVIDNFMFWTVVVAAFSQSHVILRCWHFQSSSNCFDLNWCLLPILWSEFRGYEPC